MIGKYTNLASIPLKTEFFPKLQYSFSPSHGTDPNYFSKEVLSPISMMPPCSWGDAQVWEPIWRELWISTTVGTKWAFDSSCCSSLRLLMIYRLMYLRSLQPVGSLKFSGERGSGWMCRNFCSLLETPQSNQREGNWTCFSSSALKAQHWSWCWENNEFCDSYMCVLSPLTSSSQHGWLITALACILATRVRVLLRPPNILYLQNRLEYKFNERS